MKKLYLLSFLASSAVALAQTPKPTAPANESALTTKEIKDVTPPSPVINPNNGRQLATSGQGLGKNSRWITVGRTQFDRPSNASTYRRIIAYPDGKKSIIWTTATDGPSASYTTRGTGYNHFNGTSWQNFGDARIEQFRTGYSNMDFDPVSGKEIVFAHRVETNSKSTGMLYSSNTGIGSNTWTGVTVLDTTANLAGVLWPRTVISGDYLMVIGSFTDSSAAQPVRVDINGVRSPQVFSRYNLRTNTWLVKNQLLPGYDGTRYYAGGGDNYAIDANGNNVAILMGGLSDDVALWKSADAGATWTKTILDSFPVPAFSYKQLLLDTPFSADGAVAVRVDNSGKAHCFWALGRIFDNDTANGNTTFSFFPGQNSIEYWYEGRPDSIVTAGFSPEDATDNDAAWTIGSVIDGRARYGNLSMTTAPSVVSSGDTLYLLYHSRTDNDVDGQGIAFTDVFVTASTNNGASWSEPLNLTATMGFNSEQIFPSVAADCRTSLKITFMNTALQGFYDASTNSSKIGPYDIIYYEIPVGDIFAKTVIGLNEANDLFTMEQNYPNPFNGKTTIPVKLNRASDVKISVVNMIGQTVYEQTFANNAAGVNNFELSMPTVKSGVYFYQVEAGDFKSIRKMIVE